MRPLISFDLDDRDSVYGHHISHLLTLKNDHLVPMVDQCRQRLLEKNFPDALPEVRASNMNKDRTSSLS